MLYLLLFFIRSHEGHFHSCIHDQIMKDIPHISDETTAFDGDPPSDSEKEPMRVVFDWNTIDSGIDSSQCRTVGQKISWGSSTVSCTQDDILTPQKIEVLKATFANLKDFISRLIRVGRLTTPVNLFDLKSQGYPIQSRSIECDIAITVFSRSFGENSSTLAVAASFISQAFYGRPIQGFIVINPSTIPSSIESENSENRYFFSVCFHELMHALGFSSYFFPKWINRDTGFQWGSKFPLKEYTHPSYPGKVFNLLTTPMARKYAEKRWNRTEFTPGVPMGVEIEEKGGSGTAGSHVKGRTFFNEVMVGMIITPFRISDLMLSLLEDMGWYVCNWSYVEPLAWGAGESMGQPPIKDFPIAPPVVDAKVFPRHYLCDPSESSKYVCSYDFSASALCLPYTYRDCSSPSARDQDFCSAKSFYDPYNKFVSGTSSVHDYMLMKATTTKLVCIDQTMSQRIDNYENSMTFGKESMCTMIKSSKSGYVSEKPGCYRMRCEDNRTDIVYIETLSGNVTCTTKGENKVVSSSLTIICPDPILICNMKSFMSKKYIDPDRVPMNYILTTILGIISILLVLFILFLIISLIYWFFKQCTRKEKAITDELNEPLTKTEQEPEQV